MSVCLKNRDERLSLILAWLSRGQALPLQVLAWRLCVSMRTIHRDVRVLRDCGHHIAGSAGRGGGIMLRPPRKEAA
jgi:predicted DNA-binding transcriptional regulator YafY